MRYNTLGDTGLLVSELCFGTMTFGGRGIYESVGTVQQSDAERMIARAIDSGINFIDTAPWRGSHWPGCCTSRR